MSEAEVEVQRKFLATEADTIAFGSAFSSQLRPGDIVKLTGELGAGKTTMVRGIVSGLGGNPDQVHSPTFSLVHQYQTASMPVFHCDFYRLPENSGLEDFGGLEFFSEPNIYLVEWPERVELFYSAIPNRLLHLDLRIDADGRTVCSFFPIEIVD